MLFIVGCLLFSLLCLSRTLRVPHCCHRSHLSTLQFSLLLLCQPLWTINRHHPHSSNSQLHRLLLPRRPAQNPRSLTALARILFTLLRPHLDEAARPLSLLSLLFPVILHLQLPLSHLRHFVSPRRKITLITLQSNQSRCHIMGKLEEDGCSRVE